MDVTAVENEFFEDLGSLSLENLLSLKVVTASGGMAEDQDLSSANVFVYSRTDILNYGWQSLAELLAYVPGLYVVDDLVSPSVVIRGASGGFKSATRIVKVMINGIEVNFRPDMTAFIGPEYIPLDTVERVEIAKGPLSALYGSNAFLATVNVITQKPRSGNHAALGTTLQSQAVRGAGGWGTISYGGPQFSLLFSANRHELDRSGLKVEKTFPKQDDTRSPYRPFFSSETEKDYTAPQGAYLNLVLSEPRILVADFQGGFQQLDANGEFQSASAMTHLSRYSVRNYWSDLQIRTAKAWGKPWVRFGWAEGRPTREDRQYLSENQRLMYKRNFNYKAGSTKGGASYDHRWFSMHLDGEYVRERHRVLYFTEIYLSDSGTLRPGDTIDRYSQGDALYQTITNYAGHLQVVAKDFIRNLRFMGDVRLDKSSLYPAELSWRGAVAYRWSEGITSRLIVGRAFQGPSAVLLFAIPGFGVGDNIAGNRAVLNVPPLVPQTVFSAEFVQTIRLNKRFEFVPAFFVQKFDNTIEFISTTAGYYAKNTATRKSYGAELTGRVVLDRLQGHLGVSWLRPLDSASGDSKLDKLPALPFFPNWWFSVGATVTFPKAYLRMTGLARLVTARGPSEQNFRLNDYQPYTLEGYVNADLVVSSMNLKILGPEETTVRILVKNITDGRRNEPGPVGVDLPVLGRTLLLDLSHRF